MSVSKKIILIGHFGVGKSSLVKRFVHQKFSDQYVTTIGVKIDKKVVQIDGFEVNMIIWDIAGEDTQQKVPASYRLGAHGALYVFDMSRPSTYQNLAQELAYLNEIIPGIPIKILANKSDLLSEEEQAEVLDKVLSPVFLTSAKTGDHVEEAFELLAKAMVS